MNGSHGSALLDHYGYTPLTNDKKHRRQEIVIVNWWHSFCWASFHTFDYEGEMIEVATDRNNLGSGIEIFVNIHRMLFESLEGQVFKDIGMLLLGYMIVFIYVLIMLGKCNCVEQKVFLSIGGILGVAMGIIVSYGLCSAFGFFYSAAHTVMPFLLLGIGIDDMFVIVQCLTTLSGLN